MVEMYKMSMKERWLSRKYMGVWRWGVYVDQEDHDPINYYGHEEDGTNDVEKEARGFVVRKSPVRVKSLEKVLLFPFMVLNCTLEHKKRNMGLMKIAVDKMNH